MDELPKMDLPEKLLTALRVLQVTFIFPYQIVLDIVQRSGTARLVIGHITAIGTFVWAACRIYMSLRSDGSGKERTVFRTLNSLAHDGCLFGLWITCTALASEYPRNEPAMGIAIVEVLSSFAVMLLTLYAAVRNQTSLPSYYKIPQMPYHDAVPHSGNVGLPSTGNVTNVVSEPERVPRQSEDVEYGAYAHAEEGKSLLK